MINENEDSFGGMPEALNPEQLKDVEGELADESKEGVESTQEDNDVERYPLVEDLPDKEHHLAVEQGLNAFRNILKGIDDYTLFASTAMYINGMRLGERGVSLGEEMARPPGDIDMAFSSREALMKFAERVNNVPGAWVANDGRPIRLQGEDAMKFSGLIPVEYQVNGETKKAEYEFEAFLNSNIVTPDVTRNNVRRMHGFNVLSLEGLRRQYEKNLRVEGNIDTNVEQISQFLVSDAPEAKAFVEEVQSAQSKSELSDKAREILNHLDVGIDDVKDAIRLQDEISTISKQIEADVRSEELAEKVKEKFENIGMQEVAESAVNEELSDVVARAQQNSKALQTLVGQRSQVLAGRKTKTAKRLASIEAALNPATQQAFTPDQNSKSESIPDQNAKAA
jgi:hypothetical protein